MCYDAASGGKRDILIIRVSRILCLVLLAACAQRGTVTLMPEAANVGAVENIFIGTTRTQEPDGSFDGGRSETVRFGLYQVSVPPNRKPGQITWPKAGEKVDPQTQFLTASERVYPSEREFRTRLRAELNKNGGEAVIFIHGYNNNFAEGIYRVAQFSHDLKLPGAVVEYSWPSAAAALGYAYDRDSALFARDGLEKLIHEVAASGAKRILLVGHSMGAGLTMEALRTAALRQDGRTLGLIGGVILISPDIDIDVFREQAHAIGTLPQPFVIFGSGRDKALLLSAALTGQADRLGSLGDLSRVSDLKVTYLDVSEFVQGAGHFVVGDSPAMIALMNRIVDILGAF
jgi:esterase/lipase superfamily enzyme